MLHNMIILLSLKLFVNPGKLTETGKIKFLNMYFIQIVIKLINFSEVKTT